MTIGSRLKKLREINNFSQEFVAEYINYTTEGYIKLEQDKEILKVDVLLELCKLYNCSESYIVHGEENINNCMKNDSKEKEHVYMYGCKLHEDDPDIIHWIERGDIMKYDENIIHDGLLNYKDLDETPEEREKRRQEDKKIGEEIRQRKKEQVHERITSTRLKELEYELHQKQKEYEETLEKFRVERVKVLEEENRMLHEKVKILQMKLDKR